MKRLLCLVAAVVMLAGIQGCDSNTKTGQPTLQNPNDPKAKKMEPAKPGVSNKPAPRAE